MANTALSVLITRCLDNLGRVSTGQTRSGATLATKGLEWGNNAQYAISRRHDFKDMLQVATVTTVASTRNCTLPTNFKHVLDIRVIDGTSSRKLIEVLPRHFDKAVPYPETNTTGRPIWYVEIGATFDLYPVPDDAYSLYVRTYQWPTVITDSATLIDYKPDKDELLVAYMTYQGFAYMQQYEDAKAWLGIYTNILRESMITDDSLPDWDPIGRGFSSAGDFVDVGNPWNNPFVWRY